MSSPRRCVLITGASTGLGLSIAKTLLQKTDDFLLLTARRESLNRFEAVGIRDSERIKLLALDICDFDQIEKVSRFVIENFGAPDVLINNAGISYRSVVEHMTAADEDMQMRVNYLGAFHLIRQFLESMRNRQSGHIINISSVGGMMAMPTMASYSASKFALEGASEALWYELKPWNVHVSLVQLGFIHSDSFRNVKMPPAAVRASTTPEDPYYCYYASMAPFVEKLMNRTLSSPESISKKILNLMNRKHPPVRISGTIDAVFFVLLRRFVPRIFYHTILYRLLPHIRKWGPQR